MLRLMFQQNPVCNHERLVQIIKIRKSGIPATLETGALSKQMDGHNPRDFDQIFSKPQ